MYLCQSSKMQNSQNRLMQPHFFFFQDLFSLVIVPDNNILSMSKSFLSQRQKYKLDLSIMSGHLFTPTKKSKMLTSQREIWGYPEKCREIRHPANPKIHLQETNAPRQNAHLAKMFKENKTSQSSRLIEKACLLKLLVQKTKYTSELWP